MKILKNDKVTFQRAVYHEANVDVTSVCHGFIVHCTYYAH